MTERFFSIRDWNKLQHYKHRNPPWVRLYRDLLRDRAYQNLSDTCRSHLVGLYLVAASTNNRIPDDQTWLKHELCTKSRIDLKTLLDSGLIEYEDEHASNMLAASNGLASRKQDALSETDSSDSTETDSSETDSSEAEQIPRKRGQRSSVPKSLLISTEMYRLATELGIPDVKAETAAMLDHFRAKGESRADWEATWRNWMRRSTKFNGNGGNGYGRRESKDEFNRREAEKLRARFDAEDSSGSFSDPH